MFLYRNIKSKPEYSGLSRKIMEGISAKYRFFEDFWKGEGPCPLLFAKPHLAKGKNYIRRNLAEQHRDPAMLLEEALLAGEPALEGIDDGIPTVRADLGTTLFPSALGLKICVREEVHPWLEEHLSLETYAALPDTGLGIREERGEIGTAAGMYRLFFAGRAAGRIPEILRPYIPDNQGVFDLSHIILGTEVFTALADSPDLVHRAQQNSLRLYLEGTRFFKKLLGEEDRSMVHGHGMISGVFFPDTGTRISEDSCSLISDDMASEFCLPYIREAVRPFGRGFLHFCGRHEGFLAAACREPLISTVNLGNPEMYDLGEVFKLCGSTGTVYFGHLDPLPAGPGGTEESMETYLERIAALAGRNRARVILAAPPVEGTTGKTPGTEVKKSLVELWHRRTKPHKLSTFS
jgi:hypothetical protein